PPKTDSSPPPSSDRCAFSPRPESLLQSRLCNKHRVRGPQSVRATRLNPHSETLRRSLARGRPANRLSSRLHSHAAHPLRQPSRKQLSPEREIRCVPWQLRRPNLLKASCAQICPRVSASLPQRRGRSPR